MTQAHEEQKLKRLTSQVKARCDRRSGRLGYPIVHTHARTASRVAMRRMRYISGQKRIPMSGDAT